jgi:inorganic phosphate transporter, PiT family
MFDWPATIVGATLFVAYANGANGTTDYCKALGWATITTSAGSVAAFFLATQLISIFQGKGTVAALIYGVLSRM